MLNLLTAEKIKIMRSKKLWIVLGILCLLPIMQVAEKSAKQVQAAKPISDTIPITVLSAGKQTEEWQEQQLLLRELNSVTTHIVANESWHSIQIHEPDVVISAIKEVVSKVNKVQEV